jgi:hypothetical protein
VCLGTVGFGFRVWLSERKMSPILGSSRRYFSRFYSYYFMIDLATLFTIQPLFIIAVGSFPLMCICVCDDVKITYRFIKKMKVDPSLKPFFPFLLMDRLTLHLPIWTLGLYYWVVGPKVFYPFLNPVYVCVCFLLIMVPFLMLDPRWPKRTLAAQIIFYGTIASHIIYVIYYWGEFTLVF